MWGKPFVQILLLFFKSPTQRESTIYKIYLPKHSEIVQSTCSQQDALNRKSTLVKSAELLLQINSDKPNQFGLQQQPKTVMKKSIKLGQRIVKPAVNVGQTAQKSSKFVPKNATCPNKKSPKKNVVKQGQM